MKNHQAIEKVVLHNVENQIDVHSIFFTLQGEGPFSGRAAVFIRLAGCNLQCPLCDTEYTEGREIRDVAGVAAEVRAKWLETAKMPVIVITGGEPFRQPKGLAGLIAVLFNGGYEVQIETNGTLPPPNLLAYGIEFKTRRDGFGPYIVVSPKTGRVNSDTEARALAYKYVLSHDSVDPDDGLPVRALDHPVKTRIARPPSWWDRPIYLQPVDTGFEADDRINREAVVGSCMIHGYTAQLQIHKILELE